MEFAMSLDEDSRHLLAILTPEDSPPMHQVDIHVLRDAMESRFPDRDREPIGLGILAWWNSRRHLLIGRGAREQR